MTTNPMPDPFTPPPTVWPDVPAPEVDAEAPHLHVYLVVDAHKGGGRSAIGWAGTDRNRAHDYARNTGGVVARLPVVGDYRKENDQ